MEAQGLGEAQGSRGVARRGNIGDAAVADGEGGDEVVGGVGSVDAGVGEDDIGGGGGGLGEERGGEKADKGENGGEGCCAVTGGHGSEGSRRGDWKESAGV